MKAVVELDVPDWQIGKEVSVYFPDTMVKHGECKAINEHKVPIQSLIDHIKTAIDVDPWAKDMMEELLKEHVSYTEDKIVRHDWNGTQVEMTEIGMLVRCKNCCYRRHDGYCEHNHHETTPDWYCADGEE